MILPLRILQLMLMVEDALLRGALHRETSQGVVLGLVAHMVVTVAMEALSPRKLE